MAAGSVRGFGLPCRRRRNRIRAAGGESARRLDPSDRGFPVDSNSEQYLSPLPEASRPTGTTLASVLEPEPGTAVSESRILDVLNSVALQQDQSAVSGGAVSVGVDGRYWQGVQQGRHTKADAEYIGATARARRREQRIAELGAAIDTATAALETATADERSARESVQALGAAAKQLPGSRPSSKRNAPSPLLPERYARPPKVLPRRTVSSTRRSQTCRRRRSSCAPSPWLIAPPHRSRHRCPRRGDSAFRASGLGGHPQAWRSHA